MGEKEHYYIFKNGDEVSVIAKISDGIPYEYESGKWVFAPRLAKIQYDDTDYDEISKAELDKLIEQ